MAAAVPVAARPDPVEAAPTTGRTRRCARLLHDGAVVAALRLSTWFHGGRRSSVLAQRLDALQAARGTPAFAEQAASLRSQAPGVITSHRSGREALLRRCEDFANATFDRLADESWDRLLPTQALRLTDDINLEADLHLGGMRRLREMGLASWPQAQRERFAPRFARALEQHLAAQSVSLDQFQRLPPLQQQPHLVRAFDLACRSFGVRGRLWTQRHEFDLHARMLGELCQFHLPDEYLEANPGDDALYSATLFRLEAARGTDQFITLYNGLRQHLCRGHVTQHKPIVRSMLDQGFREAIRLAHFECLRRHSGVASSQPVAASRADVAFLVDRLEAGWRRQRASPGGAAQSLPAYLLAQRRLLEGVPLDALMSAYVQALGTAGITQAHLSHPRPQPEALRLAMESVLRR